MTLVVLAGVVLVGLACGSFASVLISRVPQRRDVVRGRSQCATCGAQIHWYDNVPLISWLVLRGKCRSCKTRISAMYPIVELSMAGVWLLVLARYGVSWTSVVLWILAVSSVALVVIDLQHRRLPHAIVLPTYGLVLLPMVGAWLTGERGPWWQALVGLAAMGGFYGLMWLVYPKGMGFGDVTTAGFLGLTAGFLGLDVLAVAAIAGPLVGGLVVIVLIAAGRAGRGSAIPYGPPLLLGAWIGFLAGQYLADTYLQLLGVSPTG